MLGVPQQEDTQGMLGNMLTYESIELRGRCRHCGEEFEYTASVRSGLSLHVNCMRQYCDRHRTSKQRRVNRTTRPQQCLWCKGSLKQPNVGASKLYCSEACYKLAQNARGRSTYPQVECTDCGRTFGTKKGKTKCPACRLTKCIDCGGRTSGRNAKRCKACRAKRQRDLADQRAAATVAASLNGGTIRGQKAVKTGIDAELLFLCHCNATGIRTYSAQHNNHAVDVVIEEKGKLSRVQIKAVSMSARGRRFVKLMRTRRGGSAAYSPTDFDILAAVDCRTSEVFTFRWRDICHETRLALPPP